MIDFNRRHQQEALAGLPGLAAEIELVGYGSVRGTLIDVRDGQVIIDVSQADQAALLAHNRSARLTVHAPGVRFEATAAPAGSVAGHAVALVVETGLGISRSA